MHRRVPFLNVRTMKPVIGRPNNSNRPTVTAPVARSVIVDPGSLPSCPNPGKRSATRSRIHPAVKLSGINPRSTPITLPSKLEGPA